MMVRPISRKLAGSRLVDLKCHSLFLAAFLQDDTLASSPWAWFWDGENKPKPHLQIHQIWDFRLRISDLWNRYALSI
jgi:hypothetical protein